MDAESTLINISIRMGETGVVGAGLDAGAAADTFIGRYQHHAAFYDVAGAGRTTAHAGRVIAVIAALGTELGVQMRIFAAGLLDHPVVARSEIVEDVVAVDISRSGVVSLAYIRIRARIRTSRTKATINKSDAGCPGCECPGPRWLSPFLRPAPLPIV